MRVVGDGFEGFDVGGGSGDAFVPESTFVLDGTVGDAGAELDPPALASEKRRARGVRGGRERFVDVWSRGRGVDVQEAFRARSADVRSGVGDGVSNAHPKGGTGGGGRIGFVVGIQQIANLG